ncbi:GSCFA domain-containing protein [Falsiroseomonas sp. E2-1-a20]|uniref:GSCFA domain-containing protein n=1 Tax=Falsiroseomonas sp. E2-1-a20 TaxID=3239300 RepID=UPI003F3AD30D
MDHPYRSLPDTAFWRRAVAGVPDGTVDPVTQVPFGIGPRDAVATAGSCFAQHIAGHLHRRGHRLVRTEPPPEAPEAAAFGLFAANYGNIYTCRHMLRLCEEAFGLFQPRDAAWQRPDGRFVDAFRPGLHPAGHATADAVRAAREPHLAALRQVFETADVLVFTLGLTEAWIGADGAAYPLAPGILASPAEPSSCRFHNFTLDEVRADLLAFLGLVAEVNPGLRCILTVSPVPLAATYTAAHVLPASSYSKAVLRVAAEEAAARLPLVAYFPSYEIITGPQARGRYFAEDLRSVTAAGVAAVMSVFDRHYLTGEGRPVVAPAPAAVPKATSPADAAAFDSLAQILCDEDALDPGRKDR